MSDGQSPTTQMLTGGTDRSGPTAVMRALPNWLTALRVAMALVFFLVLTYWRWDASPASRTPWGVDWLLLGAAGLFVVAVITDALDGYLARRWDVESMFGRIMDPFADKVLVVGAFIFLAGPDFWQATPDRTHIAGQGIQISGVYPWMVVVIFGRELLVTSIRGALEGQGIKFPADWWGKAKMILQSVAIPLVLVLIAVAPVMPVAGAAAGGSGGMGASPWGRVMIDATVWAMLIVTAVSGVPYVRRCLSLMGDWRRQQAEQRAERRAARKQRRQKRRGRR